MLTLPCEKPALYEYSPHKSRMLLLDRLDNYSTENSWIETSVHIKRNSEFFDQVIQGVPVWISFEFMAQSIALLSGINHRKKDEDPKIGFIMAVRNFQAEKDVFKENQRVSIKVEEVFREGNLAVFDGTSCVGDQLYSSTSLNVIEHSRELADKWKMI